MPIKHIAICDTCGKVEDYGEAFGDTFSATWKKIVIINTCYVYCTDLCYEIGLKGYEN